MKTLESSLETIDSPAPATAETTFPSSDLPEADVDRLIAVVAATAALEEEAQHEEQSEQAGQVGLEEYSTEDDALQAILLKKEAQWRKEREKADEEVRILKEEYTALRLILDDKVREKRFWALKLNHRRKPEEETEYNNIIAEDVTLGKKSMPLREELEQARIHRELLPSQHGEQLKTVIFDWDRNNDRTGMLKAAGASLLTVKSIAELEIESLSVKTREASKEEIVGFIRESLENDAANLTIEPVPESSLRLMAKALGMGSQELQRFASVRKSLKNILALGRSPDNAEFKSAVCMLDGGLLNQGVLSTEERDELTSFVNQAYPERSGITVYDAHSVMGMMYRMLSLSKKNDDGKIEVDAMSRETLRVSVGFYAFVLFLVLTMHYAGPSGLKKSHSEKDSHGSQPTKSGH